MNVLSEAELDKRLEYLFDDIGAAHMRGNGCGFAGHNHRQIERPILKHLTNWAKYRYNDDREFRGLNDPKGLMQFPPVDAYDTTWTYIAEIKRPSYDSPEAFDATSKGLWVNFNKYNILETLCGRNHKPVNSPFKSGIMVYGFKNGTVLMLSVGKLHKLLKDQLNKMTKLSDARWITQPTIGNGQEAYAVPSMNWTNIGNYLTGKVVNWPYVPIEKPDPTTIGVWD